jgi:hypothetical protein
LMIFIESSAPNPPAANWPRRSSTGMWNTWEPIQ